MSRRLGWLSGALALAAAACGSEAHPVTFEIANAGSAPLFMYGHLLPVSLGDDWLITDACEYCVCGERCDAICGQALPSIRTVPAGSLVVFVWDGSIRMIRDTCQVRMPVRPGAIHGTVTFGHARDPGGSAVITDVTAQPFSFDHPPASGKVRIELR
jgi:hypothetical protein